MARLVFLLAFLFLMPLSAHAAHHAPKKFTCTEGFGLYEEMNGFELSGMLPVPEVGYTYEFGEVTEPYEDELVLPLKLIFPKNSDGKAVDTAITIKYELEMLDPQRIDSLQQVNIPIDSPFTGGASQVTCER